jgi:hypothetical protein
MERFSQSLLVVCSRAISLTTLHKLDQQEREAARLLKLEATPPARRISVPT